LLIKHISPNSFIDKELEIRLNNLARSDILMWVRALLFLVMTVLYSGEGKIYSLNQDLLDLGIIG